MALILMSIPSCGSSPPPDPPGILEQLNAPKPDVLAQEASPVAPRRLWCSTTDPGSARLVVKAQLKTGVEVWGESVAMAACPADGWVSSPNACNYGDNPSSGTGSGGCVTIGGDQEQQAAVDLDLYWDYGEGAKGECKASFSAPLDSREHVRELPCGLSVVTLFQARAERSNSAVNAPHSVVTALAQGGKRRAVGRARYRER